MTVQEVTKQALLLSLQERARVAEIILQSIDEPNRDEVAAQWMAEAERRSAEIESGAVRPVPLSDVLGRLDRQFA